MPRKTILIVSDDIQTVQHLQEQCHSQNLLAIAILETAQDDIWLRSELPDLLCIDACKIAEADVQRLLKPFVLEACLNGIPLVVLTKQGQRPLFDVPEKLCLYLLAKGPKFAQCWVALLGELLDCQPQTLPSRNCRH